MQILDVSSDIDEIDKKIFSYQDALSSLPRSCHHQHGTLLLNLAILHLERFYLSNDAQDIETSILQFTHAIFRPFDGHLSIEDHHNIISTLYHLIIALRLRSRRCKHTQASDVEFWIKCLHFLRDSSHEIYSVSRKMLTEALVRTLAIQVKLEPANAIHPEGGRNILEEMSGLCGELFTLDISKQDIERDIDTFAKAVYTCVRQWNPPSQRVIEFLHEVNRRLSNLHFVPFVLFMSYTTRFYLKKSISDYDDAMAVLDKIKAPHPPSDGPSPYLKHALRASMSLAHLRFQVYGNPEDLEEAIYRFHTSLGSISPGHPRRRAIEQSLLDLERTRFDEFGITNGLPGVDSGDQEDVDTPSFSQLSASLAESNDKSRSISISDRIWHLDALVRNFDIAENTDIEGAVQYFRLLLKSLQQSPEDDMSNKAMIMLGYSFLQAFRLTNNTEYLNEAIDTYRGVLKLSSGEWMHFDAATLLISCLLCRGVHFDNRRELDELLQLFRIAATSIYANISKQIYSSWNWARLARKFRHPSVATAYVNTISLMQAHLTFAPTIEMQHFRLVSTRTLRSGIEKLPLDYASYQVQEGKLKEAIETLEQGRGLLWSELRGMRTSIDQLCRIDSYLGEKFATINRHLEALTTSVPRAHWSTSNDIDSGEMDPFGRTVMNQRNLLDERNSLITQIRSLPSFENFMMPPSFETLRSAAANGPVIIVNHSQWRSDIIILLYNSPPSLIPTEDNFYECAKGLKEQLLAARKEGLDSKAYEEMLTSVLKSLYDLVGKPIIQRLRELKIPEQSRIWWCPTSDLCSLPLHAMGPVRLEGGFKLYFSDLYIPSYTLSLSALVESHKPSPHSFEKPSILLVAQPDEYMPAAWREISLIRNLDTTVTTLSSKRAIPSTVMKRLQDHRFAHFSCHGDLEAGKPFDAFFKLYQGKRLTLLEVIRSQLPSAEFAFLSACHTAELTEESIADEGLHLSAAVQYSGFRSVVGTMWEVADIDGHVIAKQFYALLFSERWKDVPYYARTAEALRDAVRKLRMKGHMRGIPMNLGAELDCK